MAEYDYMHVTFDKEERPVLRTKVVFNDEHNTFEITTERLGLNHDNGKVEWVYLGGTSCKDELEALAKSLLQHRQEVVSDVL